MKKENIRSTGTCLKFSLLCVGFCLIFVLACVFNIFGFSFDAIKGINPVKIYEIFVIVFCFLAAWIPLKIFKIASSLRQIYKKLSLIRSRNTDSKGNLNREKIFHEYESELKKNKTVSTIWNDYKATFIDSTKTEYLSFNNRTRANADLYFNVEEIVSYVGTKLPTVDLLKIVSGTFVGLGILGTFMGFSQALSGGIDIQNQAQLNVIVNGLKVAFNTSIFGLFSSITYDFLIANPLLQLLNDRCKFLSDELDTIYYISDEECIRTLGHIVYETKESITSSTSDMAKKVADAILEGREAFTAELYKTTDTLKEVSSELGKTPESIKTMNEELSSSIENAKEKNQEMINSAIESIKENIETLFTNFSSRFDTASQTMATSMESVKNLPEYFNTLLSDSSEQFKTNLSSVMEETKNNLTSLIDDYNENIKKTLETSSSENITNTKTMLEATKESFSLVAENMKESFEKCTNNATDEFKSVISETRKQLNECQDSFTEAVANSVDQMNSISEKLSSLANDYSIVEESLGNVSSSIKEAEADLSSSVKIVFEEAPGKMRSLVNDLSEAAISVNTVMDSVINMKELPSKVEMILQNFTQTTNQLDTVYNETMDKILELHNKINNRDDKNGSYLVGYAEKLDSVTRSMENREGDYINLGKVINENFDELFSKISELSSIAAEKKDS